MAAACDPRGGGAVLESKDEWARGRRTVAAVALLGYHLGETWRRRAASASVGEGVLFLGIFLAGSGRLRSGDGTIERFSARRRTNVRTAI